MTAEQLRRLVEGVSEVRLVSAQGWELVHDEVAMGCLIDEAHDRIRLLAPIVGLEEVDDERRAVVLEANFHTTLDARYATARGMLYALFVHRLSTLTAEDLTSALDQVAALVHNYGGDYSSGALIYGPDDDALH